MDDFSLPIAQQPRLVLLMPFAVMAIAALSASAVFIIARSLGGSQAASGVAATCCILAGIAFGIWSATGAQGTIRFLAPDRLEVDARWRAPRRVELKEAGIRNYVWRRGRPSMLVGVYLELSDTAGRISIGSSDIELAQVYQTGGVESSTIPPSVTLRQADFRRLLAVLPAVASTDRER